MRWDERGELAGYAAQVAALSTVALALLHPIAFARAFGHAVSLGADVVVEALNLVLVPPKLQAPSTTAARAQRTSSVAGLAGPACDDACQQARKAEANQKLIDALPIARCVADAQGDPDIQESAAGNYCRLEHATSRINRGGKWFPFTGDASLGPGLARCATIEGKPLDGAIAAGRPTKAETGGTYIAGVCAPKPSWS